MKKWEYIIVQLEKGQSLMKLLESVGSDGWEAWFFDPSQMNIFLKREQQEKPKLVTI